MRLLLMATAAALCVTPAMGQTDRFAPDNPWYRDFEQTCRQADPGQPMHPQCQGGVIGAFAEFANTAPENIHCDFGMYWIVSDDLISDDLEVLPWQYGVEAVLFQSGEPVCRRVQ